MKRLLLIFILQFIFTNCVAQLIKDWDFRYGGSSFDDLEKVIQTFDSGYLLAGSSSSDSSGDKSQNNWSSYSDFWIVRTNSIGTKLWDKHFGGTDGEILFDAIECLDKGFLLGGFSDSEIGGNKTESSRGGRDFWIVKTDSEGNFQWDKRYGGTGTDNLFSLIQTKDKGFLLGGFSDSDSSGDKSQNNWSGGYGHEDIWIVRIDSVGNKIWDKRYGGLENDGCRKIYQTVDGGFLLAGGSESDNGGDKTQDTWGVEGYDYWIVKIDSIGNKIWDRDYGADSYEALYAFSLVPNSNNILLGGVSHSLSNGDKSVDNWGLFPDQDFWIIQIDSNENKIWDQHFGGIQDDYLTNIELTKDNCFLASGFSQSDISGDKTEKNGISPYFGTNTNAWMIKFDSNGKKQWEKTLVNNGDNFSGDALETKEGGFIIGTRSNGGVGFEKSQDCRGYTDYFFAKFHLPIEFTVDSFLCQKECVTFNNQTKYEAVLWEWFLPGGSPSTSTDKNPVICYNNPGVFDVTLISYYGGKYDTLTKTNFITVNPTAITPVITQTDDTLTSSFAFGYQWYLNQQIIPGATNQIYVTTQTGQYSVEITDANGCNSFSENFEVGIFTPANDLQFQIFPNPASDLLNINFSSSAYPELELKITNPLGQLLFQSEIKSGKQLQINTAAFKSNGMVYCQFFNNEMLIETRKVFIAKY